MPNVKVLTLLGIGLLVAPFANAQAARQVEPGYGNPGYGNPGYADPNQGYGDQGYANPDQGYVDPGYGGQVYIDPGPPPACPYGYYPYYPYACAPYGYYGPSWFSGGDFIGVGPWGWGWRRFFGGLGFGGRGYYGGGRAFSGRRGFR